MTRQVWFQSSQRPFFEKIYSRWEDAINRFIVSFKRLGISVTPETHIIFVHLKPFVEINQRTIFRTNVRSSSCKIPNTLATNNYVKDPENPKTPEGLRRSVVEFNSAQTPVFKFSEAKKLLTL
jgi:hypothetical protein